LKCFPYPEHVVEEQADEKKSGHLEARQLDESDESDAKTHAES
jgi:hypothetical protein